MTELPWRADRELGPQDVRAVVEEQLPEHDPDLVEYLGSGWDSDAYAVSTRRYDALPAAGPVSSTKASPTALVLRFPRRREVAERIPSEVAILSFVEMRLAGRVPVPRVMVHGRAGPHFPYPFLGHALLPGVAADELLPSRSPALPASPQAARLAAGLGEALSCIHAIPVEEALSGGIGIDDENPEALLHETRRLASAVGSLRSSLAAVHSVSALDWLDSPIEAPAPPVVAECRFIHNDLAPEHILVEPETGALTGIIDWSDAAIGDSVLDFLLVVLWGGWPFANEVLSAYRPLRDAHFMVRLDFLAKVRSLKWLCDAIQRDGDVDKHLAWVENAFEPRVTSAARMLPADPHRR